MTGGAAALTGCGRDPSGGDDAPDPDAAAAADARPDADPGCRLTRGDAQGPFFVPGAPARTRIADEDEPGERIVIDVEVLADGCTEPVEGAVVDVWQADRDGGYHAAGKTYRLRGQAVTPADGRLSIETIRPGHYENGPGAWRPAHVHFTFAHPDHVTVTTQLYFEGDPYLQPNDGCGTCGSDDGDRIIALLPDRGVLRGSWRVVLRRR